jgi:Flp pilus assembly protein TadG
MTNRTQAMANPARRFRNDSGAAAVEFALVLPLLMVMLFGIFEFGRAWNIYQVITDAAREGARRAVVHDGLNKKQQVTNVVQTRLQAAGLTWSGTLIAYTDDCADWSSAFNAGNSIGVSGCGWDSAAGTEARVAIKAPYPFQFLKPLLPLLAGGGSIKDAVLSTNFVMRNE